jgi:3-oxoacyl-(acyl-carrier-protein) synthase
MGVVTAIGCDTEAFFESLVAGRSGVQPSSACEKVVVASVDFAPKAHFSPLALTALDRFSQFTLVAAEQAVQ